MSDLLLGIDVGTTACKAAIVDAAGAERAHGSAPTPWERVPTGAEIDPHALRDAALAAARAALREAPEGRLRGIGVAGMAETGVLLDGRGEPLGVRRGDTILVPWSAGACRLEGDLVAIACRPPATGSET